MIAEKDSLKNGYVGGFFNLFDWKAKSRKKLFPNRGDAPEDFKREKRYFRKSPKNRLTVADDDDDAAKSMKNGGCGDYSCASSVTDDDGYGSRAPGVVARLMGLNTMPNSNFDDSECSPFVDLQSIRECSHTRKHVDYYQDHQMMFPENLLSKEEILPSKHFLELKPKKTAAKPIEKFQTEVLPPKSAKSIPITHHKLLSPIKNPGFIPSNTAAHIMEAAVKIIESNPQSIPKAKFPSLGSSSLPLKVINFNEKLDFTSSSKARNVKDCVESDASKKSHALDASRRTYEKSLKPQQQLNGSLDGSFKGNGKSVSLAIQAKINVQKRENINMGNAKGMPMVDHTDSNEISLLQPFRSHPSVNKTAPKKPTNGTCPLKPNGLKQNTLTTKEKSYSKSTASSLQSRRTSYNTNGRQKSSNKTVGTRTGSRKMNSETSDKEKDISPYNGRNSPRKKRLIDSQLVYNVNTEPNFNSPERLFGWEEQTKRKGVDVVSFTFSTPLNRQETKNSPETRTKRLLDTDFTEPSSTSYNMISSDALSNLLEQKLKELNKKTQPNNTSIESDRNDSSKPFVQKPNIFHSPCLNKESLQASNTGFIWNPFSWKTEETGEVSTKTSDYRHPSPVSVLDNPVTSTSIDNSVESSSKEGCKTQPSAYYGQEIFSFSSSKTTTFLDLSDSASSLSSPTDESNSWDNELVEKILSHMESRLMDYISGKITKLISPHLLDQLEARRTLENNGGTGKVGRKALFDYAVEFMEMRVRRHVGGGYWTRDGLESLRKEVLGREMMREVATWKSDWSCMVEGLLERDMRVPYGKWWSFEADVLSVASHIESQVFDSLLSEIFC